MYWSRQEAVVVAVPSLGRPLPQLQPVVGYFINMLPVTSSSMDSDMSWDMWLGATRDNMRKAQANADVPFLEIMRAVQPARDPSTTPIFQAILMPSETDTDTKAPFGIPQHASPIGAVSCRRNFAGTMHGRSPMGIMRSSCICHWQHCLSRLCGLIDEGSNCTYRSLGPDCLHIRHLSLKCGMFPALG